MYRRLTFKRNQQNMMNINAIVNKMRRISRLGKNIQTQWISSNKTSCGTMLLRPFLTTISLTSNNVSNTRRLYSKNTIALFLIPSSPTTSSTVGQRRDKNRALIESWSFRSCSTSEYSTSKVVAVGKGDENDPFKIQSLGISKDNNSLCVTWDDGNATRYPYMWLRDNCRCNDCYDSNINERTVSFRDISVHKLKDARCADDGTLNLTGTDDHITIIDPSWLKERNVGKVRDDVQIEKEYFGSDLMTYLPRFNYQEVINDDATLYKWMLCLKKHGLAWIEGAPRKTDELLVLGKRISHLRETFYGVVSKIKSKPETFFLGYTSNELPLHSDYNYGSSVPGILIIHGIQCAPSGGRNLFVDGFKLADDLRRNDFSAFQLLSTAVFNYEMNGTELGCQFDHRCSSSIFRTNWLGEVDKVVFSDHTRTEYLMNIDIDDVPSYYEALQKFITKAYSPEYLVETIIKEGDIVMIDNFRLLHGREKFVIKDGRGRHVESIYIDQDDFDSRLRVLHKGK